VFDGFLTVNIDHFEDLLRPILEGCLTFSAKFCAEDPFTDD
jgi:hypothetical protein